MERPHAPIFVRRVRKPTTPRVQVEGHAVAGPRFYVWQEDRCEAESWARELSPLRCPPPRTPRSRRG